MPYASLEGIGLGCRVDVENAKPVIYPHPSWLGRIINAFGEAIDGKGPLIKGDKPYFIKSSPRRHNSAIALKARWIWALRR